MPDILSQGGGRESGPWPRRVAAAAILVLVAVTIVHYLPRSRHGTARPVRAAVTATPLPAVSGDAGVAEEPDGITGQLLSWPGGLRLPASGQRPVWYWPATGRVIPIGGLPLQQSGYQFIRAAGGWAVQVSFGDDADDGALAVQLELASMASGRMTAVPETWVSSDALVGFGWPASSDSLVAELSFTTKVQLASWHPGASRLAIAVLKPQHSPASLVIGQYSP